LNNNKFHEFSVALKHTVMIEELIKWVKEPNKVRIYLVKKSLPYQKAENSLFSSQQSVTEFCPETDEFNPQSPMFFIDSLLILFLILCLTSHKISSFQGFHLNVYTTFSSFPYKPHTW